MGALSYFELQKALYATLVADATLTGLVSGVYERVPEGTLYPYVVIGGMGFTDRSTKTGILWQVAGVISVFSRAGGRKEAVTLCDRIHTLLHQAQPVVSGHALTLLRITGNDVFLEEDGLTYRGITRFVAMVAPA